MCHEVLLADKIRDKTAKVAVIGLGYVGLPLARVFVEAGFQVLGFDTDQAKIDHLLAGRSYIGHVSGEWIGACVAADRLIPTANMGRLGEPDIVVVCVPTPLDAAHEPDLSFVAGTARQIAAALRPGQLVVLESTTYPGTTRRVVAPILAESGLAMGQDFFLAYSPEREDPGNRRFSTRNIPKLVGGLDSASARLASSFYRQAVAEVVPVDSCEIAEAAKILENVYRSVNIAMVNEMKMLFDRLGIDIWEVIAAAETKPFGFQAFYPGPGWGGHCIPVDPFYLSWLARQQGLAAEFIELAGRVNLRMPAYIVERLKAALEQANKPLAGSRVCLLGVAYKRDIDDPRESPAFELLRLLIAAGAEVSYNDPLVPKLPKMRRHQAPPLASMPLTPEFLAEQDAVIIVTDHSAYDYEFIVRHARLVVDTRNATREVREGREKIVKA